MTDDKLIHYLRRDEINTQNWDGCIRNAANGLIYAHSFYLDQMAGPWDALVLGNFEAVMPLTYKRKWRIHYLYQPSFVQQLGIFSQQALESNLIDRFFLALKARFSFAEIFINALNPVAGSSPRNNYVLDLSLGYPSLCEGYKEDLIKNLKRVKKFRLAYVHSLDYADSVRSFRQTYGSRFPQVRPKDFQHFNQLCQQAMENGMLLVRRAETENGEILAQVLLLKDERRLYNIMSTTTERGRRWSANHFLFEELIREHAGKKMILDFEGSEIPGISRFYQKFGAVNEPYYFFRYNQLSRPLRWIKK
jgi:hypothetical protein